jgi:hypothetical protein
MWIRRKQILLKKLERLKSGFAVAQDVFPRVLKIS